jgi:hypothetical protein
MDRATSGCDPNPDRQAQESYALHMAHALSGTRRDGTPLPALADFDHDGTFGLLDAHTWARIEANSFDVPTTTSERWLERHASPVRTAIDPQLLPEDMAVVERLGAALGLSDDPAARLRWTALRKEIDALGDQVTNADAQVDVDTDIVRAALLQRWPMLDDPQDARARSATTPINSRGCLYRASLDAAERRASCAAVMERIRKVLATEHTGGFVTKVLGRELGLRARVRGARRVPHD